MVKVIGPLGGFDASGSLAGSIVFSKWKGRNYVRRLVKPSNPKSGGQVGVRSMFGFLAQKWAALTNPNKATWEPGADTKVVSPFNEYMSVNQKRWRNFLPPGQQTPLAETGTVATPGAPVATAGIRQITLDYPIITTEANNWGLALFKGPTAFSTAFSNCIAVILADAIGAVTFVDTPLIAGDYFYNARFFTDDGVLGDEIGELTATVS